MPKDTIAIVMEGEIPLPTFVQVMGNFSALVQQLSDEVVGPDGVEWDISLLKSGSATAAVRGDSYNVADVERVVLAYGIVGQAIENKQPIPYSDDIAGLARAITTALNSKVTAIRFVTDDHVASITEPSVEEEETDAGKQYSLGTITGVIETISLRGKLKFTLYDSLFDRAVTCRLERDQQEVLREAWGKRVTVSGWIFRDPDTGRPVSISRAKLVKILDDVPPSSYKRARGIIPWRKGDDLPEVLIRRVRNAN